MTPAARVVMGVGVAMMAASVWGCVGGAAPAADGGVRSAGPSSPPSAEREPGSGNALSRLPSEGPEPASTSGLTRAQVDEILGAHNTWRTRVGVRSLGWADDLRAMAQSRAETLAAAGCLMGHGALPADVGENLFRGSPMISDGRPDAISPITPTQVVDAWGAESAYYSPSSDTCAPGRQCAHYTQLVWPATTEVGCGKAICASQGQIWVCRYRPRGNVRIVP